MIPGLLALVLALGRGLEPDPKMSALLPSVVEIAAEATCDPPARLGQECGPLLVDAQSFLRGARAIGDVGGTADAVRNAIGVPFEDLPSSAAYECNGSRQEFPCMIVHSGVHLGLESIHRQEREITLVVQVSWAEEATGRQPRLAGIHVFEFTFLLEGECWVPARVRLIRAV